MRRQSITSLHHDARFSVVIVCEHASARFGGEAILPLHYFRLLRNRGIEVWLLAHARTRPELTDLFPGETRIRYVEESTFHRLMWRFGRGLPHDVAYVTTGFASRLSVQFAQRKLLRELIAAEGIDLVHQPTPVSPREPSFICDVGAPVVIGPMNGGMVYPPAFRTYREWLERALSWLGRRQAALLNRLLPGKRRAAVLLVANERTRAALPQGVCSRVEVIGENGVQLDLWTAQSPSAVAQPMLGAPADPVTFAFVGRLVKLKAAGILLDAFAIAAATTPMHLLVIGDGPERERLQRQAAALFPVVAGDVAPTVRFTGWLTQSACASELARTQCLVMPSLRECGGAVMLEAMSLAKPVIATAWGGALDYLDESCGVLVEPRDREALVSGLAEAMVRIADSPSEREAMGRAARRRVERLHDWEVKAGHVLAIYRQVLQAEVPSAAVASAA